MLKMEEKRRIEEIDRGWNQDRTMDEWTYIGLKMTGN